MAVSYASFSEGEGILERNERTRSRRMLLVAAMSNPSGMNALHAFVVDKRGNVQHCRLSESIESQVRGEAN